MLVVMLVLAQILPTKSLPVSVPPLQVHVTMFFDTNDTSITQYRVSNLKQTLKESKIQWSLIAKTSSAAKPFQKLFPTTATPIVIVQDPSGKIIRKFSPTSPNDILQKVQGGN